MVATKRHSASHPTGPSSDYSRGFIALRLSPSSSLSGVTAFLPPMQVCRSSVRQTHRRCKVADDLVHHYRSRDIRIKDTKCSHDRAKTVHAGLGDRLVFVHQDSSSLIDRHFLFPRRIAVLISNPILLPSVVKRELESKGYRSCCAAPREALTAARCIGWKSLRDLTGERSGGRAVFGVPAPYSAATVRGDYLEDNLLQFLVAQSRTVRCKPSAICIDVDQSLLSDVRTDCSAYGHNVAVHVTTTVSIFKPAISKADPLTRRCQINCMTNFTVRSCGYMREHILAESGA